MRMDSGDWSPIAMPWQLLLSAALLVAGSAVLQWVDAAFAWRITLCARDWHFLLAVWLTPEAVRWIYGRG